MPATGAELLREGRARLAGREADWLLAHVTGATTALLRARDDAPLDPTAVGRFRELLQRRAAGEPLAYLLGTQPFRGLELLVDDRVLIPRPETETLVEHALACRPADAPERVLDLGTGSGAIALALAAERPAWRVTAVDVDPDALAVARANGERLGLDVRWKAGDWFAPVAGERFALIVSNPPYVATPDPDLAPDVAAHEPARALRAGVDGLDAIRAIAAAAPGHLAPGGRLLLEHGARQASAVRRLLSDAGLAAVRSHRDDQGRERVTEARPRERDDG